MVSFQPSIDQIRSLEAHPLALRSAIRQVESSVEPPSAMVVPEVMVRAAVLLAA